MYDNFLNDPYTLKSNYGLASQAIYTKSNFNSGGCCCDTPSIYDSCLKISASSLNNITIKTHPTETVVVPMITNIKILNPNKVVGITFDNKKKIKTICDDRDIFSLEYACFLAYAKLLYSDEYTHEGILNKAEELQTKKLFVRLVKLGINKYKSEEQARLKKEKKEAEEKAIKIRKKEKAELKRKRSQEAQIKNIANIMKETLLNK